LVEEVTRVIIYLFRSINNNKNNLIPRYDGVIIIMITKYFRKLIFIFFIAFVVFYIYKAIPVTKPIKVGVLHSLSGTMAISEKPLVNGILLAIKEINQKGGLLGRQIKPIIIDGKSDNRVFKEETINLIKKHKVDAIFACWTSSCRKEIKPIIEKNKQILFYPVQYEGLEESKNIIYTGATPNQQIIPAFFWALENLGKRMFLVSSDYVFSHAANAIMKDLAKISRAEIVGEEYQPLGSIKFSEIIEKIKKSKADVILNTINGDSNIAFFKQLKESGVSLDKTAILSFSLGENELQHIDRHLTEGSYSSWSYFQSIFSERNQDFVKSYHQEYGKDQVLSDPVESAYFSVKLWANAVTIAGVTTPEEVLNNIKGQALKAPEGMVIIDHENLNTWKQIRIGQANIQGQYKILWNSISTLKPRPYPRTRSKKQWQSFLQSLYVKWGNHWEPSNEKN